MLCIKKHIESNNQSKKPVGNKTKNKMCVCNETISKHFGSSVSLILTGRME